MNQQAIRIPIELFDTNSYRNHSNSKSQLVLKDDMIMHECMSTCDFYNDGILRCENIDYYLREVYKKESVAGVSLCSAYYSDIRQNVYHVVISCMGVSNDIFIKFIDRKEAHDVYKTIFTWIFDE